LNKKAYYLVHLKYIFGACSSLLCCLLPVFVAIWICFGKSLIEKEQFFFLAFFYFLVEALCFKLIFYKKFDNKIPNNHKVSTAVFSKTNESSCKDIRMVYISKKRTELASLIFIRPRRYFIVFSEDITKFSNASYYALLLHEIAHAKIFFLEYSGLLKIVKINFAFLIHVIYYSFLQNHINHLKFTVYFANCLNFILLFYFCFSMIECWTARQNEYLADILSVKFNKNEKDSILECFQKIIEVFKYSEETKKRHFLFSTHPAINKRIELVKDVFLDK